MTHRPAPALASDRMRQSERFLSGHGFSHAVSAAKSSWLQPLRCAVLSFAAAYISNLENATLCFFAAIRRTRREGMSSRTQPRHAYSITSSQLNTRMEVRDLLLRSFRFPALMRRPFSVMWMFAVLLGFLTQPLYAQLKPLATIQLDCRASAISSQGLTACVAFHQMHFQKYTIERDDIWTVTMKGKRRQIVNGARLVQTDTPFSFAMRKIAFSPDGKLLTIQMTTAQVGANGSTNEQKMVDLMDTDGKEIPVAGTKTSVILDASDATWLADDQTVAYLLPAENSDLLFRVGLTHPKEGKGRPIFEGHLFTAIAWDAAHSSAVAIERTEKFDEPIKLVRLDLIHQTDTVLATLPAYLGRLTLSPAGNRVAYYTDGNTIEVRALDTPQKATTVDCAYGTLAWGNYEDRILLKRGPENKTSDLVWLGIPSGNLTPILHDLFFKDFAISPQAHAIVVTQPGDNHLAVFPLK